MWRNGRCFARPGWGDGNRSDLAKAMKGRRVAVPVGRREQDSMDSDWPEAEALVGGRSRARGISERLTTRRWRRLAAGSILPGRPLRCLCRWNSIWSHPPGGGRWEVVVSGLAGASGDGFRGSRFVRSGREASAAYASPGFGMR